MNETPADKEVRPVNEGRVSILVVEDNPDDYEIFTQYLELAQSRRVNQWDARNAQRLTEALEVLQGSWVPDLIVLDLSLPDSSGMDTFRTLQSIVPRVPIVILSGMQDEDLALDLVNLGAQDYLSKNNLRPEVIARSMLYALERKRSELREKTLNDELVQERSEVNNLQMQLIQAEKLESLGRMAAGVAHEVKNPLNILLGAVDYFANKPDQDEMDRVMVGLMKENIDRADKIISGMVDFSRNYKLNFEAVDPNHLVEKAILLKEHELRLKQVELDLELAEGLPKVEVDPLKIEQVLVNLIGNAGYALADGGKMEVSTYLARVSRVQKDEGLRIFDQFRVDDFLLVVEVRDYGKGIPEDRLRKVFDPFFTTKPTGEGTGLGLSVSKKIIDLHHGALLLENADPPGVRARILLPVRQTKLKQKGNEK